MGVQGFACCSTPVAWASACNVDSGSGESPEKNLLTLLGYLALGAKEIYMQLLRRRFPIEYGEKQPLRTVGTANLIAAVIYLPVGRSFHRNLSPVRRKHLDSISTTLENFPPTDSQDIVLMYFGTSGSSRTN